VPSDDEGQNSEAEDECEQFLNSIGLDYLKGNLREYKSMQQLAQVSYA
jgi:hypothetical protein